MFTDRLAMGLQGLGAGVLNPPATGPAAVVTPVTSLTPSGSGTVGATICQDASGNTVDCSAGAAIYCSGLACDPNVAWAGTGVPATTASLISDMQAGYNYLSQLLQQTPSTAPCSDAIGCFTIGSTQVPETPVLIGAAVLIVIVLASSKSGGRRR